MKNECSSNCMIKKINKELIGKDGKSLSIGRMPYCCSACGGPYPSCMSSCKIFDD